MKSLIIFFLFFVCFYAGSAQEAQRIRLTDSSGKKNVAGARLQVAGKTFIADSSGIVLLQNIPAGKQTVTVEANGYAPGTFIIDFPLHATSETEVMLVSIDAPGNTMEGEGEEAEEEEEEVIVMATRTSRTIVNTPTRIEVISGEELSEKGNMKPGDIRMLLNESTGIQTQQTSATSYNAGIRIQGLEGRYTQLLRDGYPLYAGFSGGLSILQVAPLDLKQVEVIKGSASTLYGGGAIAGLVNLVSKTPGEERIMDLLVNGTSAGGLDLSGFYSERYKRSGLTVFASRNSGIAFDPANIGFTAIPEFERYTINPRFFLYGKNTQADIGVSLITENRLGGSMDYIRKRTPGFFEKNNTGRLTAQAGVTHQLNGNTQLQWKNSYSFFDRSIAIPDYKFEAVQQQSYSEFNMQQRRSRYGFVGGVNLLTDVLKESRHSTVPARDYNYVTVGAFLQHDWSVTERLTVESGLRYDHVNAFGGALLPRIAVLFRPHTAWTLRAGGGLGYKAPSIFTEATERIQFRDVLPIEEGATKLERSAGANFDVHFRARLNEVSISINQLFYYTRLNAPLVIMRGFGGGVALQNANGYLDTRGVETNLRFLYADFKLFIGYTFTDAQTQFNDTRSSFPLTAKHRLNNVLMYEVEEKWKLGLEAYYYSRQKLGNGSYGRSYWITGFMAEKLWKRFSVFLNFENFTGTRQSKFGPIYTGNPDNPQFSDIYAPVEGFVVNGGVKVRL